MRVAQAEVCRNRLHTGIDVVAWRTEPPRWDAEDLGEHVVRPAQLLAHAVIVAILGETRVRPGVVSDLMACRDHLEEDVRVLSDDGADHEECRMRIIHREGFEDLLAPNRRAIVERQRDAAHEAQAVPPRQRLLVMRRIARRPAANGSSQPCARFHCVRR